MSASEDAGPEAGDARVQDADLTATDGQRASGEEDASSQQDAGADNLGQEAGNAVAADARTDGAGMDSLTTRVCGDGGTWPSPLPLEVDKRTALPVGTETFGFIEGPVWLEEQGVLLFSDMDFSAGDAQGPPSRIRRLSPPSSFDVFVASSNSNGLALTNAGTSLLAATHDNQGLSLFQFASGTRTPLTVRVDGKRFNSPNDLTVRSDGTVYFTDPDWQLGARSSETKITGVYRVDPPLQATSTLSATLIEGMLDKPNGIALSPDERSLYVGSSGNEIWKYDVAADGTISGRTKFADTGNSDGMAIDCAGDVYVASDTVEVFAPSGVKLGDITLADTPSNAAFGGADHRTLYITAGTRLYALALNVPGLPY